MPTSRPSTPALSLQRRIAELKSARDALPPEELAQWVIVSLSSGRALSYSNEGAPSVAPTVTEATRFAYRTARTLASRIRNAQGDQAAKAMRLGDAMYYLAHKSQ